MQLKTPDKRIEEIVDGLLTLEERAGDFSPDALIINSPRAETYLRITLTQYHQDMISEMVEKLEKMKVIEIDFFLIGDSKSTYDHSGRKFYNQALTEAQSIIKSTLLESKN